MFVFSSESTLHEERAPEESSLHGSLQGHGEHVRHSEPEVINTPLFQKYTLCRGLLSSEPESRSVNRVLSDVFRSVGPGEPYVYSHPKLQKLDEVVLQHFETWAESSGTPTHTCIRVYTGDDGIIPNRGIISDDHCWKSFRLL